LIFFFDIDWSTALSTQLSNVAMSRFLWFIFNHVVISFFFEGWLEWLKQFTSIGYNAWEVCEDKVIISNLTWCACYIASKITCYSTIGLGNVRSNTNLVKTKQNP